MAVFSSNLFRRDGAMPASPSHTTFMLLFVLIVLALVALLLVAVLLFMRYRRRRAAADQGQHAWAPEGFDDEKRLSTSSHHRRVMVRPSESVYIYHEKKNTTTTTAAAAMTKEKDFGPCTEPPSPTSPVPEIRITFPEEYDATGKRTSGRVVVVRVGDGAGGGVGLEPVGEDDQLPAYDAREGFQSIELERIGGLVEKAKNAPATAAGWE